MIRFYLIPLMTLLLMSCEAMYNPFEKHVTTSVDVAVVNNGTEKITTYAITQEHYDANHCSSNGQARSSSVAVNPGQSIRVSSSIECNTAVYGWVSVTKQTNYDIGYLNNFAKSTFDQFIPGLQFEVTDQNHQNAILFKIVALSRNTSGYDHLWPLAPANALQVAWLEDSYDSWGNKSTSLNFSLPKGSVTKQSLVQFRDDIGITFPDNSRMKHDHGYYYTDFDTSEGPAFYMDMKSGQLICDDVGCNKL